MSRVVKDGFEAEFSSLMEKKQALLTEKNKAIEEAVAKVEERFADRAETIEKLLLLISDEIPEEEAEALRSESEEIEMAEEAEDTAGEGEETVTGI